MTWNELVKQEASAAGFTIDDETAGAILWESTGFPGFWNIPKDGSTPQECCRTQLREFFAQARSEGFTQENRPAP